MSRSIRSTVSLAHNAMAGPSRIRQPLIVLPVMQKRTMFDMPKWLLRRQKDEFEERRSGKKTDLTEQQASSLPIKQVSEGTTSTSSPTGEEGTVDRPTELSSVSDQGIFQGLDVSAADDELNKDLKLALKPGTTSRTKFTEHWYTSGKHKIAPKKLRLLAKQITGLPVSEAILQMQYSLKGAAAWIKPNLVLARQHAINYKRANPDLLMVSEAFVNKDVYGQKRIDIKARGKFGIRIHPYCRLKFVLRHGKPMEQVVARRFTKAVNKKARSATEFPERAPLRRRVNSGWAW